MPSFSLRRSISLKSNKKKQMIDDDDDPVQCGSDNNSPDGGGGGGFGRDDHNSRRRSPLKRSKSGNSRIRRAGSFTKRTIRRSLSQSSSTSSTATSTTRRNSSSDSQSPSRRNKQRRRSSFKKTKGFNKDVSHLLEVAIQNSPILSSPVQSNVEFYNPQDVVKGRKIQSGEFFDISKIKYLLPTNKHHDDDDDDVQEFDNNDESFSGDFAAMEITTTTNDGGHQYQYHQQPQHSLINSNIDSSSGHNSGGSSSSNHSKQQQNNNEDNNKLYVLKQISHRHSKEKQIIEQATLRLVMEAKFLSRLNHPNILAAKGMTRGEEQPLMNGGINTFFIVMESCVETLEERLDRWKRKQDDDDEPTTTTPTRPPPPPPQDNNNSSSGYFDLCTPNNQLKMKYAMDLAKALKYLHNRNIVVLNLRPETIGFTSDGTIQIRDLSCCREMMMMNEEQQEEELQQSCKEEEELGGGSGGGGGGGDDDGPLGFNCDLKVKGAGVESQMAAAKSNFLVLEASVDGLPRPRYVAPEAILEYIYTPAADTYSWGHILFELLTLSKPYALYKLGQLLTKVCLDGSRPNLSVYRFSQPLESLLQLSWEQSFSHRPSMDALLEAIPLLMQLSSSSSS